MPKTRRSWAIGVALLAAGLGVAAAVAGVVASPAQSALRWSQPLADNPTADRRPLRVMMLGDSITFGMRSTDRQGYQTVLAADFRRAGVTATWTNRGFGGETIGSIAARTPGLLGVDRPDVVLLDAGTNDAAGKPDNGQPKPDPIDRAPLKLAALVNTILAASPNVWVVLARVSYSTGFYAKLVPGERLINAAVPGIAAAHRDRVVIADMSGLAPSLLAENIHPNDAGYAWMAAQWWTALRPVLADLWPPIRPTHS
jgi:lysophospholipase L1-like esterase